ncbi:arginase family protein [Leucobacter luti]|uniref:arginase family protein n=1 Tax=Leucobacter luti TaxID=340320 RepID=UPI003CFCE593
MPQWQGSPSSRAMRIAEGAELIREDLPSSARIDVEVPLEAGDALGTPIARLSGVLRARDAARAALGPLRERASVPIIVGGDGAISLAGLESAVSTHGGIAVLWFDAHPALQEPTTSPSGAASHMTLRHALGDGAPDLASPHPVAAEWVTLVGTRASDPDEALEITRLELTVVQGAVTSEDDADGEALAEAIRARLDGVGGVYIHVSLTVLDPAEFSSVHAPEPFGLTAKQLAAAIRAAVTAVPLVGATVCEFAPADAAQAADDLPTVLRILGALTSGLAERQA